MADLQDPKPKSVLSRIYDLTATPYVSLLHSGCILASPIVSPAVKVAAGEIISTTSSEGTKAGLTKRLFKNKASTIGLTRANALLFGGSELLGSWMIYDDDIEDGSGFLMAWSTLFLIVNGKSSLTALKHARVWPFLLSSLACVNLGLYGKRYITNAFE